jgi:hypothetical protein
LKYLEILPKALRVALRVSRDPTEGSRGGTSSISRSDRRPSGWHFEHLEIRRKALGGASGGSRDSILWGNGPSRGMWGCERWRARSPFRGSRPEASACPTRLREE